MDTLFVIGLLLSFKFRSDFEKKSSSPCKAVYILRNVSYRGPEISTIVRVGQVILNTIHNGKLLLRLAFDGFYDCNVTYGYHLLTLNSICLTESDM